MVNSSPAMFIRVSNIFYWCSRTFFEYSDQLSRSWRACSGDRVGLGLLCESELTFSFLGAGGHALWIRFTGGVSRVASWVDLSVFFWASLISLIQGTYLLLNARLKTILDGERDALPVTPDVCNNVFHLPDARLQCVNATSFRATLKCRPNNETIWDEIFSNENKWTVRLKI